VKCKEGFKGDVCLSSKHVEGYINLFETTGIPLEVFQILKCDKKMYRLTMTELLTHGKKLPNSRSPNDPYYAWKTDRLEAVMENLPVEIFETSYR
jgi:hypothetical protein